MNELDELGELRGFRDEVPAPGPDRLAAGRARLLRESRRGRPRFRRPAARFVLAACAAVLVGAGGTVVALQGGSPPAGTRPVSATVFLERAAAAAERDTGRRPANDQWVYTKVFFDNDDRPRQARPRDRQEQWIRFDGLKSAYPPPIAGPGEQLKIVDNDYAETYGDDSEERTPAEWYDYLRGLPGEPSALLAAVYRRHDEYVREFGGVRFPQGRDQWVFSRLADYLARVPVVPPSTRAAVFRALGAVPGVQVRGGAVDALGRSGTAVVRTGADGVREEVVIATGSYAYLGVRMVTTVPKTFSPRPGLGAPKEFRRVTPAGEVLNDQALEASGIVDEPGARP
ncbi:CU044_5270 family protein [Actinomadura algeriensis]|uniref:CU044_5270 family protein n=1 Tax=Actinomadura algeriensis TaxID=1679523 RepID=A0ABR9JUK0_9ACTN|nr:CU044_5270 family protein [Actinomadura algeriensis]MBE1534247.1 hypothetical protein [Actinomadura algeriensis]